MNAVAGLVLCLLAALVAVFLVIAPRPRVPAARRRAPGSVHVSALSRVTDRTVGVIDDAIRRRGSSPFEPGELEQAGIGMPRSAFALMVLCAAAVLGALGLMIGGLSLWTILVVPGMACLAPLGAKLLIVWRSARRRSRFAQQLDDTLTLMAGGLRAGHSLLRAIDAASRETDAPTSEELARVVNETRIGRDLAEGLDLTADRMRSDDFRWVAQAIAINREVGGNLSQVLDQVGHTIRERNQIRRQVTALSAEGRLSAVVLIMLPIAVFAFLMVTQPGYFTGFLSNIVGILALVVALVLLVLGSLWLAAAVRVRF